MIIVVEKLLTFYQPRLYLSHITGNKLQSNYNYPRKSFNKSINLNGL